MAAIRLAFLLLAALVAVASAAAPGPAAPLSVNLTAILDKAGQYTTFIKFLNTTRVGDQVDKQASNNNQGMTVFAPTDNAFQNLKQGLINSLSEQDQVKLILYHVLPKFYALTDFQTVSNPVQTQASTENGKVLGLTVTYLGVNNVNVSTGIVLTTINNALSNMMPLAVYQVDKVLLPEALFGAKAPSSAPSGSTTPSSGGGKAEGPVADHDKNAAYGVKTMGFSFVALVGFLTMGFIV